MALPFQSEIGGEAAGKRERQFQEVGDFLHIKAAQPQENIRVKREFPELARLPAHRNGAAAGKRLQEKELNRIRIKRVNKNCSSPTKSFDWDESPHVEDGGRAVAARSPNARPVIAVCSYCGEQNKVWLKGVRKKDTIRRG
jgi:hypothetical protein